MIRTCSHSGLEWLRLQNIQAFKVFKRLLARAVFGCEQQAVWEWRGVDVVVGVEVVVVDVAVAVGGVDGGDGVVAPLPPPLLLPPSPSSLRGCQLVCSVHVGMLVLGRV